MDRRTLLAITLCFAIFMAWQKFYIEPRMPAQQPAEVSAPTAKGAPAGAAANPANPAAAAPTASATLAAVPATQSKPETTLTLRSGTGDLVTGSGSKIIRSWLLKDYHVALSNQSASIGLGSVTHEDGEVELAFDDQAFSYLSSVQGTLQSTPSGALWTYEDANISLRRELSVNPASSYLDLKLSAEFKTKKPAYGFVSFAAQKPQEKDAEEQDRQFIYFSNQSVERVHFKDATALKELPSPIKYAGATSRYFVFALLPQGGQTPGGLIQPLSTGAARMSLVYPVSGNSLSIPLRVYFGPKELDLLRSVEPTLDHAVDFGWFTVFAYPLLKLLKWFYQYVGNYGVAIILLTLLLKILTYPLTYKSMKSMKEMARLQPQLQKLREKHKDDKEALNREMLTMMKSHGYNPMAGCLPILIQMPIFFALYRVLYGSIDLYHAPFALWIHDLSASDPFYVTPILLSITMFIQQKMTPNTATDPVQAKMIQFMPLIFGAMMLGLPSGLTLYMLVNAIASIAQQMILNKKLDAGHVTGVAAKAR